MAPFESPRSYLMLLNLLTHRWGPDSTPWPINPGSVPSSARWMVLCTEVARPKWAINHSDGWVGDRISNISLIATRPITVWLSCLGSIQLFWGSLVDSIHTMHTILYVHIPKMYMIRRNYFHLSVTKIHLIVDINLVLVDVLEPRCISLVLC